MWIRSASKNKKITDKAIKNGGKRHKSTIKTFKWIYKNNIKSSIKDDAKNGKSYTEVWLQSEVRHYTELFDYLNDVIKPELEHKGYKVTFLDDNQYMKIEW